LIMAPAAFWSSSATFATFMTRPSQYPREKVPLN
jgi:hypothetical protein